MRIGLTESLNVLIDIVKLNEKRTIMLGTVYSLPFFLNFKLDSDNQLSLFSLINALVDVNNENVKIELRQIISDFFDEETITSCAENGLFPESNIAKIQKMFLESNDE